MATKLYIIKHLLGYKKENKITISELKHSSTVCVSLNFTFPYVF